MDVERAVSLSSEIGSWLNGQNPVLPLADDSLPAAREAFFQALRERGLLAKMDSGYRESLFDGFRVLDGAAFMQDPYLQAVRLNGGRREGAFLLTPVSYQKGELFQYRMPDYSGDYPRLSVGCFSSAVQTLALYENEMPWMTVCPSEISSMERQMQNAHGRVLTLGLGLGYYAMMVSRKPDVSSVTVIEREKNVISLFSRYILPFFPEPGKIRVIEADALDFCAHLQDGQYDYCFADLWAGQEDGAPLYLELKDLLAPCRRMETEYWIEKEIRAYLVYRFGGRD